MNQTGAADWAAGKRRWPNGSAIRSTTGRERATRRHARQDQGRRLRPTETPHHQDACSPGDPSRSGHDDVRCELSLPVGDITGGRRECGWVCPVSSPPSARRSCRLRYERSRWLRVRRAGIVPVPAAPTCWKASQIAGAAAGPKQTTVSIDTTLSECRVRCPGRHFGDAPCERAVSVMGL